VHKARGKPSNRRKPEKVRRCVLKLCEGKYSGFGPTPTTEKLLEVHGIDLSV